jgi:hypothetical protein
MVYSGYPNSQQPNFPLFPTYNLNGLLTFNLQNSLSRAIAKTHNHPTTEQD